MKADGTCGVIAITLALVATSVAADAPDRQTPAPVIYLADNLDEADRLGWCIDTIGRGFGDYLQAHSCKPQGGDVQFAFEADTGMIRSVAFPDYCMETLPDADPDFGLVTCASENPRQHFAYNAATQAISPANAPEFCVIVGAEAAPPDRSCHAIYCSPAATTPIRPSEAGSSPMNEPVPTRPR